MHLALADSRMSYFIDDAGDGEPSPEPSPEPVVAVPCTGSVAAGLFPGGLPSAFPEAYEAGSLQTEPVAADSGYPAPDGSAASGISSSCNPSGSQGALQPDDATEAPADSVLVFCEGKWCRESRGSMEAVVVAEAIGIGEMVSYYSPTHNAWLPAIVLGYNFIDGVLVSYDLDIKHHALAGKIERRDLTALRGVGQSALPLPPQEGTAPASSSGLQLIAGSAEVADVDHSIPFTVAREPPSSDGPISREPAVHDTPAMLVVGQPALSMPPHEGTAAVSSSDTPPNAGSAAVADVGHLNPVAVAGEPPSHDGPDDAVSAVTFSDLAESVVDIGPHFDAASITSTAAPEVPTDRVGHGRRAPRPPRQYGPPCRCGCHSTRAEGLGPRSTLARRCSCPMCGHRSVEQGHGCHNRVEIPVDFTGVVLCPRCCHFCMAFLRWGDAFYDSGGQWPRPDT